MTLFQDRHDAGRALARSLDGFRDRRDVVVLGLPRGGVPVAFEVARGLGAPLDVFVVRKLGVPGHEELAMGAIASGGVLVWNEDVLSRLAIGPEALAAVVAREQRELVRREALYRSQRPRAEVVGRVVILVDDGVATGSTMLAALRALTQRRPAFLVAAVPVGAPSTCHDLRRDANEVVCLHQPEPFFGVGLWYGTFEQTSDDEVRRLLSMDDPPRTRHTGVDERWNG